MGGVTYLSDTFRRDDGSLESYMETVQAGMLNNGVANPVSALKEQHEPSYDVSVSSTGTDMDVDPENGYVHLPDGSEEYVIVGSEDGAIGVISSAGGHILYPSEAADHYLTDESGHDLVSDSDLRGTIADLLYEVADTWEHIEETGTPGRGYVDLDADDAGGTDDISVRGVNEDRLASKYESLLDRLEADGEVVLDKNMHLGSNGARGNHIVQEFLSDVKRMDAPRGMDTDRIEGEFDENTPRIIYRDT